jgi:hypothetical protein
LVVAALYELAHSSTFPTAAQNWLSKKKAATYLTYSVFGFLGTGIHCTRAELSGVAKIKSEFNFRRIDSARVYFT